MSPDENFSDMGATRMQRVNQVCNRFEAAWRSGERPNLAEHLASAPAQEQPVLARMLIELDVDYRRMHGETPQAGDYRSILPFEATWLESLVRGAFDATRVELAGTQETSGEFVVSDPHASRRGAEILPRILGDYLLLERIGGGGMGVVYKAEHQHMRRIVALKLIRPEHATATTAQQRFQREMEAAARLHHPNIVTAYDARVEQGTWCLISEFVPGKDLARVVQESGPLELNLALRYVIQTAEALEYAHQQGVIHRDIKPSNLLLDHSGKVKVLDMGLARLQSLEHDSEATQAAARLTQTGYVVGTIDFMSPEQAKNSAHADERSDIYSLGCTLYYLLTGEAAYRGTTVMEKLLAHREQPIPLLAAIRGDVSTELDQMFQRLLAKQPEDRYQTMSEVIVALKQVAEQIESGELVQLTSAHSLSINNSLVSLGNVPTPSVSQRQQHHSFPVKPALLLGGLLLLAGMIWAGTQFWKKEDAPSPQNPAAANSNQNQVEPGSANLPVIATAEAAEAQSKAASELGIPVEISNDLQMQLRLIPAQHLQIGERTLSMSRPIYIGAAEVTVGQFRQFVDATKHVTDGEQHGGWGIRDGRWQLAPEFSWRDLGEHPVEENFPVVNISWNDAQAFCTWLSSQPKAEGTYRLPSEEEWELACRAGSTDTWFFGDDRNRLGEYAWYEGTAGNRLQRVGEKSPNAFGCHDMLGNESEWCTDLFTAGGTDRVQKGGSFSHRAEEVTCAARWSEAPAGVSHGAFRVVREVNRK
jgi:eukaryotic-like serine/threonine-protein kinase